MKDKIAEVIDHQILLAYCSMSARRPYVERAADQILSLLKGEGWTPPITDYNPETMSEVFAKAMRARGWLHKDDPVDEVITLGDLIRMWENGQLEIKKETPKDGGYYGEEQ